MSLLMCWAPLNPLFFNWILLFMCDNVITACCYVMWNYIVNWAHLNPPLIICKSVQIRGLHERTVISRRVDSSASWSLFVGVGRWAVVSHPVVGVVIVAFGSRTADGVICLRIHWSWSVNCSQTALLLVLGEWLVPRLIPGSFVHLSTLECPRTFLFIWFRSCLIGNFTFVGS